MAARRNVYRVRATTGEREWSAPITSATVAEADITLRHHHHHHHHRRRRRHILSRSSACRYCMLLQRITISLSTSLFFAMTAIIRDLRCSL